MKKPNKQPTLDSLPRSRGLSEEELANVTGGTPSIPIPPPRQATPSIPIPPPRQATPSIPIPPPLAWLATSRASA